MSKATDGGDLSVTTAAALVGTYGMQAVIDDNHTLYVKDETPNAEKRYRARFYFDPNSITITSGNYIGLLVGYSTTTMVTRLELRYSGGAYQVRARLRHDNTNWTDSSWLTISDATHYFEIDWRAATSAGSNDGGLTFWIDGTQQANLTGVDNDTRAVDYVWLGAENVMTGTSGTLFFDAFESRRSTYIGELQGNAAPGPFQAAQEAGFFQRAVAFLRTAFLRALFGPEVETAAAAGAANAGEKSAGEGKGGLAVHLPALPGMENPAPWELTEGETITITYQYDPLYRLEEANYSNELYFHYTYDAVGNRLTQEMPTGTNTYQYDDANRLIQVDEAFYEWDDNGNLLNDGVYTYTYNTANQLITASSLQTTANYAYNGLGDRLRQTVDGVTTNYAVDLASGLAQVLQDGESTYLYGVGRIAQHEAGGAEYFLGDALGSVRQLVDANGEVTLAKAYQPYGEVMNSAGVGTTSYGFTGEWTDATELMYLRARYYATHQGRFITRDAWEGDYYQPMSYNTWLYGYGNPVNVIDPSGKYPQDCSLNGNNSRNLTGWLVREMHAQSNQWPVWPGMGQVIYASNAYLGDAKTRYLAQTALDTFRLSDPSVSEEEWDQIYQEFALGGGLRIIGFIWWAEMVKDGARWDFKDQILDELDHSIMLCDGESCDWYGYSMPGNIFYAYVGRAVGLSEFEIRMGAVYAQQTDPENQWWTNTWWGLDQGTDVAALELGFQMFNAVGRTSSDATLMVAFQNALKAKKGDMEHQPVPVIPYVTTYPIGPDGPEFPLRYFDGRNFIGIFGGW